MLTSVIDSLINGCASKSGFPHTKTPTIPLQIRVSLNFFMSSPFSSYLAKIPSKPSSLHCAHHLHFPTKKRWSPVTPLTSSLHSRHYIISSHLSHLRQTFHPSPPLHPYHPHPGSAPLLWCSGQSQKLSNTSVYSTPTMIHPTLWSQSIFSKTHIWSLLLCVI